jgi:hypothetical protein
MCEQLRLPGKLILVSHCPRTTAGFGRAMSLGRHYSLQIEAGRPVGETWRPSGSLFHLNLIGDP